MNNENHKQSDGESKSASVGLETVLIWQYQIGQRVRRDAKEGKVIKRYSKQSEVLDIFYPELYDVEWDDNQIKHSFLAHGLRAI